MNELDLEIVAGGVGWGCGRSAEVAEEQAGVVFCVSIK